MSDIVQTAASLVLAAITPPPAHPQPDFKIIIGGTDKTTMVNDRLISMGITDNRGLDADQLDLELDDTDGALPLPPKGTPIQIFIGWKGQALVDKGFFTVDEVEHSGAPDTLSIRARSASLSEGLGEQKERSFHNKTIGEIVNIIAKENSLEPLVSEDLAKEKIEHVDQTNESDTNLLSRIAENYDAIATIKYGKLLFIYRGSAMTASGTAIEPITITRSSGDGHRFSVADRESYSGVKAYYTDNRSGKKLFVIVDKTNEVPPPKPKTPPKTKRKKGTKAAPKSKTANPEPSGSLKSLRHVYASEANAWRGARSAFQKLKRGAASLSLNLARGIPELFPETPIYVVGIKAEIDSFGWLISTVKHSFTGSGYSNELELELQPDEELETETEIS